MLKKNTFKKIKNTMKIKECENVIIKLGENACENTELIKISSPDFLWIHLKSFPSGHVVIESDNCNQSQLKIGMRMCLDGTKYRNMKDVKFSVTKISNIVCTKKKGEVQFKSNKKVLCYKL